MQLPSGFEEIKSTIMNKISCSRIEEILQQAHGAQAETELQAQFDLIGQIVAESFNHVVSNQDIKIPNIAYISQDTLRGKKKEEEKVFYPDGIFCRMNDTKAAIPIQHSLVMIELKMDLLFKDKTRPWNYLTRKNNKTISELARGSTAVVQSFRRSVTYFEKSENIDRIATSMLTDLKQAQFLQLTSSYCTGEQPSWEQLKGSLTFPLQVSNYGDHPVLFPALETLIQLLLDATWPKDLVANGEVVDIYMKDFQKNLVLTMPSLTNRVANETLQIIKENETITLKSMGEIASNSYTTIMAVSSQGVEQCLKMEKSQLFNSKYSQLANELEILPRIQHLKGVPKLVHRGTISNYKNDSWVCMVTQPLGVSFDHLPHSFFSSPRLTISVWSAIRQIMIDIHESGFLHCDIKPANMIMSSAGPYLIDFGGAVPNPCSSYDYDASFRFTAAWAPFSLIDGDDPNTLTDHMSLFFSFLDLISEGKLINLGEKEPIEITQLVLSTLPEGFHCWARHLLYVFGLYAVHENHQTQENATNLSTKNEATNITSEVFSDICDSDSLSTATNEFLACDAL